MDFEEWWEREDRVYLNEYSTFKMVAAQAWKDAFEEGYKFANKENEEYDKTLTGDSAV
jgi:hypothetical protein